MPERILSEDNSSMSKEEFEIYLQEKRKNATEEEITIMDTLNETLPNEVFRNRDMPEGTVTTNPYYSDLNVLVTLK